MHIISETCTISHIVRYLIMHLPVVLDAKGPFVDRPAFEVRGRGVAFVTLEGV